MIISILSMSDPMAGQVLTRSGGADMEIFNDVPVWATIHVGEQSIKFDCGKRGQPNLAGYGGLESLTLMDEKTKLPYYIDKLVPTHRSTTEVHFRYEFDNEQWSRMIEGGLRDETLEVIDPMMRDNDYELPMRATLWLLHPRDEGDVPVVFYQLSDNAFVITDKATSGYDFADNIVAYMIQQQAQREAKVVEAKTAVVDEDNLDLNIKPDVKLVRVNEPEVVEAKSSFEQVFDSVDDTSLDIESSVSDVDKLFEKVQAATDAELQTPPVELPVMDISQDSLFDYSQPDFSQEYDDTDDLFEIDDSFTENLDTSDVMLEMVDRELLSRDPGTVSPQRPVPSLSQRESVRIVPDAD